MFKLVFQVDPAFAHFTNLTELNLGRNRLRSLGNLPEGLVTLSCAANELSGMGRPYTCGDEIQKYKILAEHIAWDLLWLVGLWR